MISLYMLHLWFCYFDSGYLMFHLSLGLLMEALLNSKCIVKIFCLCIVDEGCKEDKD